MRCSCRAQPSLIASLKRVNGERWQTATRHLQVRERSHGCWSRSAKETAHALNRLFPIVYAELRALAHRQLARIRPGDTLQTTALVHEAYLKLLGAARPEWHDRRHFFAVASRAMRQISVDYARTQAAQKRGGDAPVLTLDEQRLPDRRSGARARAARSGADRARVLERASGAGRRAALLWRAFGRRDCSRDGGVGADGQARVAEGARVPLRRPPTRRPR